MPKIFGKSSPYSDYKVNDFVEEIIKSKYIADPKLTEALDKKNRSFQNKVDELVKKSKDEENKKAQLKVRTPTDLLLEKAGEKKPPAVDSIAGLGDQFDIDIEEDDDDDDNKDSDDEDDEEEFVEEEAEMNKSSIEMNDNFMNLKLNKDDLTPEKIDEMLKALVEAKKDVETSKEKKEVKNKPRSKLDKNKSNPLSEIVSVKTSSTKGTKTSWDVVSVISDITDFELDTFDADFANCEYDGFNPQETIEMLMAYAEKDGLSREEFFDDMKFLSPFVVLRGTNITSIMDRSADVIKDKMKELVKRYNIQPGENKGFVSKDKIILSRIPACFPMYASVALAMGKIEPKCSSADLPVYLHHSAAASLIPTSSQDLFNKWLIWAKEHDKLINGKGADADKVESFGTIIWRSPFISNEKREAFATKISKIKVLS